MATGNRGAPSEKRREQEVFFFSFSSLYSNFPTPCPPFWPVAPRVCVCGNIWRSTLFTSANVRIRRSNAVFANGYNGRGHLSRTRTTSARWREAAMGGCKQKSSRVGQAPVQCSPTCISEQNPEGAAAGYEGQKPPSFKGFPLVVRYLSLRPGCMQIAGGQK